MSTYRPHGSDVYVCDFVFKNQRVRESTDQTSKTLAREYEENRKQELRKGIGKLNKKNVPNYFAGAAEAWLKQKTPNWSPNTTLLTRSALKHILPIIGQQLIVDFDERSLHKLIGTRETEGASESTIQIELRTVRAILRRYGRWAAIQPHSPAINDGEERSRAITREEEETLLFECSRSRSRQLLPFVTLALNTGARYSTLLNLRWLSIDFAAHTLTIGKDKTKHSSGRVLPLNQRAFETLAFLAEQFPDRKPSHYVFPVESVGAAGDEFAAKCYNTDPTRHTGSIQRAWKGAKARTRRHCPSCESGTLADRPKREGGYVCTDCQATVKELPPGVVCRMHDLRATAVTRMLNAGVSVVKVGKIAGWSDTTMIKMAKRYAKFQVEELRGAMETITNSGPESATFAEKYPQNPPRKSDVEKPRIC
jgi:integrase